MRIAYYAPMNVPDDGRPSGDRWIARQIMEGLRELGHEVELVSRLKSWASEPEALSEIQEKAAEEITRLEGQHFDAWFTYHVYYKAPDLLGPTIAAARGIPYFIAEASLAPSRKDGPWAEGSKLAHEAIKAAQHIFSTCPRDVPMLERELLERKGFSNISALRPWVDLDNWKVKHFPGEEGLRLHTTAMMRSGDKLKSYQLLALALEELETPWSLNVVGDGPAKDKVDLFLSEFGPRINFTGTLDHKLLKLTLGGADIFVWPGLGEGLGLAYLEAMAAGVAVVAVDGPGVRGVLNEHVAKLTDATPEDFAAAIVELADPVARASQVAAAMNHVARHHSKADFIRTLSEGLEGRA